MLDFRKVLLAAAVAGLGLVGSASAQTSQVLSCGAPAPTTGIAGIRAEGSTEQLPLIQATCTGGINTNPLVITVTTSVPLTNVTLGGTNTLGYVDSQAQLFNGGTPIATAVGTRTSATSITYSFNTAALINSSVAATNSGIQIGNLRVNATQAAGVPITAALSAPVGGGVYLSSSTAVNVAIAQTTLNTPSFVAYANVGVCNIAAKDLNAVGYVQVANNFAGSFTSDAQEIAKETTQFFASLPSGTTNPATAAGATIGTRLALTFGNLINGATYYLPGTVTNGNLVLVLVPTATTSCSPACPAPSAVSTALGNTTAGSQNIGSTSQVPAGTLVAFTPTAGAITAYYAVAQDSGTAALDTTAIVSPATPSILGGTIAGTENTIILYEALPSQTLTLAGSAPTVTVALSGNTTNYTQLAPATAPTAVTALLSKVGAGFVTACNTTILFPYIINTLGYDTGISIANAAPGTSVGTNTNTVTASGSCTLNLWGAGSLNGTAVTPFALAPITVASGQVYAFTLSSALATTANAAGFAGYGVAQCNFQGAHGFAFITDGFGAAFPGRGLSQGYLAPVLSDTFSGAYVTINPAF